MKPDLLQHLTGMVISLGFSALIWMYYRRKVSPVSDRYSTFGPRFWTGGVDGCVLKPVAIAVAVLTPILSRPLTALLIVFESLVWIVYTVVMHARHGQTVGKMVTRVRVVDLQTEGSITWRQAWLREGIPALLSLGILVWTVLHVPKGDGSLSSLRNGGAPEDNQTPWLLSAIPLCWFVAEVLTMLTNEKRRALHDIIAGTVVIRTNIEKEPVAPPATQGPRPPAESGDAEAFPSGI